MEQYISEQFKVTFKPMANSGAVIEGERYRISFLTSRLIRLEYEENGCFEDHASQAFWYREQEVPALKIKETEDIIEASTEHLRLRYVKNQPFSVDTLSIELKYSCKIWRYGTEEGQNLKEMVMLLLMIQNHLFLTNQVGYSHAPHQELIVISLDTEQILKDV